MRAAIASDIACGIDLYGKTPAGIVGVNTTGTRLERHPDTPKANVSGIRCACA